MDLLKVKKLNMGYKWILKSKRGLVRVKKGYRVKMGVNIRIKMGLNKG